MPRGNLEADLAIDLPAEPLALAAPEPMDGDRHRVFGHAEVEPGLAMGVGTRAGFQQRLINDNYFGRQK